MSYYGAMTNEEEMVLQKEEEEKMEFLADLDQQHSCLGSSKMWKRKRLNYRHNLIPSHQIGKSTQMLLESKLISGFVELTLITTVIALQLLLEELERYNNVNSLCPKSSIMIINKIDL